MLSGVARACAETGRDEEGARFLFFGGTDLWTRGSFSHGGLLWSAGGLDREGFTFKLLLGAGTYRYRSGALGNAAVAGGVLAGFALPGWRFVGDRLIVTVFAGLDAQNHHLAPDDPSASLRGTLFGLRGGFELWHEPDNASMLAADASASTVGPSYSGRVAFGWKMLDRFYAGPEIQAFAGGTSYRQLRAGLHLTAMKTETFEWSAAGGWARDSEKRNGLYGRIGILRRH
jgi:hypothetical protein